jgi:hypothetical protein
MGLSHKPFSGSNNGVYRGKNTAQPKVPSESDLYYEELVGVILKHQLKIYESFIYPVLEAFKRADT